MNDDAEDEIICQVASAHWNMIWKYTWMISHNIVSSMLPGPGESFRTMILQPGPFMIFTLLLIVFSIIIQSRNQWIRTLVIKYQDAVIGKRIPNIVAISGGADSHEEYHEGIAGGYSIQGRRGTMEDRHSIIQNVVVADGKVLSFFGVYDGHGGEYVAEYTKNNLFKNTIQKLRDQAEDNKNNERKGSFECDKGSCLRKTPSSDSTTPPFEMTGERRESTANYAQLTQETFGVFQAKLENLIKENADNKEEESSAKQTKDSPKEPETEQPLKKEDAYSALNLKKDKAKKIKIEKPQDVLYIDQSQNINYTKLLTDQLMDIDKKVVKHCKSVFDLSGTTAVIAILDGELLIIGNVGDSRAVMGSLNGTTTALSIDHKPNQTKEKLRIQNAGGFIHFNGVWRVAGVLATSRALGDFVLKDPRELVTAEPDVLTFSLKDHKADFVILATDGVWDVMSNEQTVAFVSKHIHEEDFGAKALVKEAYKKGSQDNITVVVLNINKLRL